MTQKSRPISDLSAGSFTPTPVSPEVNEPVPDCSSIVTGMANGAPFRVKLAKLVENRAGPQTLTVRLRNCVGATDVCVWIDLIASGKVIASTSRHNPGTDAIDVPIELTTEQIDEIRDYGDLSVRVQAVSGNCASTIQTACCTQPISRKLNAAVTFGDCTCGVPVDITLIYDPSGNAGQGSWIGYGPTGCGTTQGIQLYCEGTDWKLGTDGCLGGGFSNTSGYSVSCNPFQIGPANVVPSSACGCGPPSPILPTVITVTELP